VVLQDGEQTPGALAAAIRLESTLVAHHLRYLREARLIRRQRRGRHVYYALDGEAIHRLVREVIHFAQQPG
jgi:DNA-binding transcriptional ArsR family regulator